MTQDNAAKVPPTPSFAPGAAVRCIDPNTQFFRWVGEVVQFDVDPPVKEYTSRFVTTLLAPPEVPGVAAGIITSVLLPLTLREEQLEEITDAPKRAGVLARTAKGKEAEGGPRGVQGGR